MLVHGGFSTTDPWGVTGRTWALSLAGVPKWEVLAESPTSAVSREAHTAVYDDARNRMVIYGGFSSNDGSIRLDTWALNLSGSPSWTQLLPQNPPGWRRWDHVAVYDPNFDRMIVHSGYDNTTTYELRWGDPPTADDIFSEPPMVAPDAVALRWQLGQISQPVAILRASGSGSWEPVTTIVPDESGVVMWEDRDVEPDGRYGYRIALTSLEHVSGGEVWAKVPSGRTSIMRPLENPARGPVELQIVPTTSEDGILELFDVSGRILSRLELKSIEPGRARRVTLPEFPVTSGLYFVRLKQGDQLHTVRVAVSR